MSQRPPGLYVPIFGDTPCNTGICRLGEVFPARRWGRLMRLAGKNPAQLAGFADSACLISFPALFARSRGGGVDQNPSGLITRAAALHRKPEAAQVTGRAFRRVISTDQRRAAQGRVSTLKKRWERRPVKACTTSSGAPGCCKARWRGSRRHRVRGSRCGCPSKAPPPPHFVWVAAPRGGRPACGLALRQAQDRPRPVLRLMLA